MFTRILLILAAAVLLGVASVAQADAVITIDLSYKVVLNPADGQPPPKVSQAGIDQAVDVMNEKLSSYWRGCRVQRVGPVTQVGGMGDVTGPSQWYDTDFLDPDNGLAWRDQMEAAAMDDPTAYAWNSNAINLYITHGICIGGLCSFPSHEIIIIGYCSDDDGGVQLHEIGHYYDLCHTYGCPCGGCGTPIVATDCMGNPGITGVCDGNPGDPEDPGIPGDDGISDTLCDLDCWGPNDRALWNFGTDYENLTAAQQSMVDTATSNLMSLRSKVNMAEGQLDRWADESNVARFNVCDGGRTRFVDTTAGGGGNGSSTQPYDTVQDGVTFANPGGVDIVLLRPGVYPEDLTITKALTLRATRAGPATIGN